MVPVLATGFGQTPRPLHLSEGLKYFLSALASECECAFVA